MSIDPLRTAARALAYWERRQQVTSNNVANTETPGFKGERVFAELLDDGPAAVSRTDWDQGALRATGRPLDVALEGAGFLVVETPDGELLRRGGSLSLDAAGVLVDGAGNAVLGEDGAVVVPEAGEIVIEQDGTIRADGTEIARLRVEDAPADSLRRVGGGLWASDARTVLEPERVMLHHGSLEESNVQALDGLVEMLEVQRNYAAIQKGVTTLDSVMDTAANRIGRVG